MNEPPSDRTRPERTVAVGAGGAAEPEPPLRLALDVTETELHDRLAALLADVRGLSIVPSGDAADTTLVSGRVPERAAHEPIGEALDVLPGLTPRELEVLDVLAEGASNREIAERLGISVHTAKFHVGSIIEKLDSSGRTDAVAYALRAGVLSL